MTYDSDTSDLIQNDFDTPDHNSELDDHIFVDDLFSTDYDDRPNKFDTKTMPICKSTR